MPETHGQAETGDPSPCNSAQSRGRPAFYEAVFAQVARIPRGSVTTYGAIAYSLGKPHGARAVGWALSIAPRDEALPCHRVVNRDGYLSGGWHWGHPDVMAALLREEGVPFVEPHRVALRSCLWIPDDDALNPWTASPSSRD